MEYREECDVGVLGWSEALKQKLMDFGLSEKDADRSISHSSPSPSGCVEWTSTKVRGGYGQFKFMRKKMLAHRLVAIAVFGPSELLALHSCDNPKCVNPEHLRWGTHKDNAGDREQRGRGRHKFCKIKTGVTNGKPRKKKVMIDKTLEIARLREDLMIQQENVKRTVSRCLDLEKECARLRTDNSVLSIQVASLRQALDMNKHVINKLRGSHAKDDE